MPSAPAPRLKRVAAAVAVVALSVGVGWLIGTEIGDKRADDRATQAKERAQRQAERDRAAGAAEQRRERGEERQEREQDAIDKAFDDANKQLLRAAKGGRHDAVARQEARLTELARRQATTEEDSTAQDPYERELDRFPIGQPPLVAQQINSNDDNHVLFVSVFASHFCLKSASERRQAVRATYEPIARRLHREVDDFELLVVPLGSTAPRRFQALAQAGGGSVSLTRRGQSC